MTYKTQAEIDLLKQGLMQMLRDEKHFVVLDSNHWTHDAYKRYEWVIAWGQREFIRVDAPLKNAFMKLIDHCRSNQDWVFGYLSYDLKNSIENLSSCNSPFIPFSPAYFFTPKHIITCRSQTDGFVVEGEIPTLPTSLESKGMAKPRISVKSSKSFEEYVKGFEKIMSHIQRGDIFEANYCIEFTATEVSIDPWLFYRSLCEISPMPFSCLFRDDDRFLISASPERFIQGSKQRVISQPMKGTAPRGNTKESDRELRFNLYTNEKERAENIMIVDLVRNDLGRSAVKGTVELAALCEVLPFPKIWQMVSTVTCKPEPSLHPLEILANAFPMGSMTGAPKVRAMEIIDETEGFGRGLFSGTIGYINADGDYDFNVVIRSLQYDIRNKKLSFAAGGAITSGATADKEFGECLLKASTIHYALTGEALTIQ